jgi:16S rRNA processing protein RimM
MKKTDCFQLGYIAKLHGFKGEVSLFLDVTDPTKYENLDAVYIDVNNQLVPFFVKSIKLKNKGFAAIKLEGVETEEKARTLLRKSVFLPKELLEDLDDLHFYDHEVIDFTVVDKNHGAIGKIQDVIDLAANPLLQIVEGKREILIPLLPGLVQKVDRKAEILHIEAPEGLIGLYL